MVAYYHGGGNTLKRLSKPNYVFKIARVAILMIVALIALSTQASACHVSIGDKVWNDLDMDGKQDKGEPGIPEVSVYLYKYDFCKDEWIQIQDTKTNEDGEYSFSASYGCYYYVKFELIEGYVFSPKDNAKPWKDSDADVITGNTKWRQIWCNYDKWDAGMYKPTPKPAGVGNYVWNDLNVNGIQEDDEDGMEGVTVKLYTCSGQLVDTKLTDEDGYYEFTDLEAGDYYIEFVSPSGYIFTLADQGEEDEDSDAQTGGATSCFTLNAGDYNSLVDAGIHSMEEIPEFPTVALPMVAIIGLAFVFGRRKE
ncbi:SdrD B-like domain-containing protein [Methanolobus bombayensis]|uniref:SdrD B-like domain-containing protein n=1 Tax=Methanolobus bombayensis TaxID=38023 RepID=UPI001AE33198|nr:5-hydroxyisourate hydrolase-like protein (transthyretin family) [Methanolobus bombayensis]